MNNLLELKEGDILICTTSQFAFPHLVEGKEYTFSHYVYETSNHKLVQTRGNYISVEPKNTDIIVGIKLKELPNKVVPIWKFIYKTPNLTKQVIEPTENELKILLTNFLIKKERKEMDKLNKNLKKGDKLIYTYTNVLPSSSHLPFKKGQEYTFSHVVEESIHGNIIMVEEFPEVTAVVWKFTYKPKNLKEEELEKYLENYKSRYKFKEDKICGVTFWIENNGSSFAVENNNIQKEKDRVEYFTDPKEAVKKYNNSLFYYDEVENKNYAQNEYLEGYDVCLMEYFDVSLRTNKNNSAFLVSENLEGHELYFTFEVAFDAFMSKTKKKMSKFVKQV